VVAAGPAAGVDAAAVLKALTTKFGGKGGGKRELAQGGGVGAPVDQLLDAARRELSN
jgi:alanyl-tRNA synthetase